MKVKTSITLTGSLLHEIDSQEAFKSRSDFIEKAVRRLLVHIQREEAERKDLELINRHADKLNAEAKDTLAYQVPL
jgi:Arc/MetJ-type ribon-helix-helix transcriptional regulator